MHRTTASRITACALAISTSLLIVACSPKDGPETSAPTSSANAQKSTPKPSSTAKPPRVRGRVVMKTGQPFISLNPLTANGKIDLNVLKYHLHCYLLTENPEEVEAVPWLAQSLPEISKDGLRQTWTLRNARWSDGRPVTTADVIFTWELLTRPDRPEAMAASAAAASVADVAKIEAVDSHRFRVSYKRPHFRHWLDFGAAFPIVPAHATPTDPKDAAAERYPKVNLGPYAVASWTRDELKLQRHTPWWGDDDRRFDGLFSVKDFEYRLVTDSVLTRELLKKGGLDIAVIFKREDFEALDRAKGDLGLETAHYNLSQWSFIGWNARRPPFDDARVRKALSHLVPRKQINARFFDGDGGIVAGPFFGCEGVLQHPDIHAPRLSPTKALALLGEAGWKDSDGDGLLDKGGRAFRFRLLFPTEGKASLEGPLKVIQSSFSQAGIRMDLDSRLYGSLVHPKDGLLPRGEFDAFTLIWNVDPLFPDLQSLYGSSGAWNWCGYANPKLDELFDAYAHADDDAARIMKARKIQEILAADQPHLWLFSNPIWVVWNKRLKGVRTHHLGIRQWEFHVDEED
ncbi:MAG TPA: hypothetical protein ENK43_05615 [Planctomycetes bacterium]|nr:hypothetical protein [Planctomycetota bacterium]